MYQLENKIVTKITLYTEPNISNSPTHIYAKQYDKNSRFILATIKNRSGTLNLIGAKDIKLNAKLPTGEIISTPCELDENKNVIAPLTGGTLSTAGTLNCDIAIRFEENGYIECDSSEGGALLVISDDDTPSGSQIKKADTNIIGVNVGSYVKASIVSMQISSNTFFVVVSDSYSKPNIDGSGLDGDSVGLNDDNSTRNIDYVVEANSDVTFSAPSIETVHIVLPTTSGTHGFMAGVSVKNGHTAPIYTFENNTSLPFVLKNGGDKMDSYEAKPDTETQMMIYCSGLSMVCSIIEIELDEVAV